MTHKFLPSIRNILIGLHPAISPPFEPVELSIHPAHFSCFHLAFGVGHDRSFSSVTEASVQKLCSHQI
jgi:hypothetical protein